MGYNKQVTPDTTTTLQEAQIEYKQFLEAIKWKRLRHHGKNAVSIKVHPGLRLRLSKQNRTTKKYQGFQAAFLGGPYPEIFLFLAKNRSNLSRHCFERSIKENQPLLIHEIIHFFDFLKDPLVFLDASKKLSILRTIATKQTYRAVYFNTPHEERAFFFQSVVGCELEAGVDSGDTVAWFKKKYPAANLHKRTIRKWESRLALP